MTGWSALEAELDSWAEDGRQATLWWRDDDAVAPGPALDRLQGIAAAAGVPLALAVIPARCSAALGPHLATATQVTVLQHGYSHVNHANVGEKKSELGAQRSMTRVLEELARGGAVMAAVFGRRALPVLVPPWNRFGAELLPALPALGLRGFSAHGPRPGLRPVPDLVQVNTHADIMRWRPRGFLGESAVLDVLCRHLSGRRRGDGVADPAEPSGILTHHLVHDEAAWDFLHRLIELLARHPAARLLSAAEAFDLNGNPS